MGEESARYMDSIPAEKKTTRLASTGWTLPKRLRSRVTPNRYAPCNNKDAQDNVGMEMPLEPEICVCHYPTRPYAKPAGLRR